MIMKMGKILQQLDPSKYLLLKEVKVVWRSARGRRYPYISIPREARPHLLGEGVDKVAFFLEKKSGMIVLVPMGGDDGRD